MASACKCDMIFVVLVMYLLVIGFTLFRLSNKGGFKMNVNKTFCDECVHRSVCVYQSDYLKTIKKLRDLFYSVPEKERDMATFVNPDCKFRARTIINRRVSE